MCVLGGCPTGTLLPLSPSPCEGRFETVGDPGPRVGPWAFWPEGGLACSAGVVGLSCPPPPSGAFAPRPSAAPASALGPARVLLLHLEPPCGSWVCMPSPGLGPVCPVCEPVPCHLCSRTGHRERPRALSWALGMPVPLFGTRLGCLLCQMFGLTCVFSALALESALPPRSPVLFRALWNRGPVLRRGAVNPDLKPMQPSSLLRGRGCLHTGPRGWRGPPSWLWPSFCGAWAGGSGCSAPGFRAGLPRPPQGPRSRCRSSFRQ